MKVLLDSCIAPLTRDVLLDAGHDVVWAGDWPEVPGDSVILERAHNEGQILVTLDKDFGEIAIVRKLPHSGIIRLVNLSVKQQATVCLEVFRRYEGELQPGVIITAEIDRVRIRPAEA